jgi:hypothetical protein
VVVTLPRVVSTVCAYLPVVVVGGAVLLSKVADPPRGQGERPTSEDVRWVTDVAPNRCGEPVNPLRGALAL